jgi:UDP-N-acetylglucosamine/UDP-N-acetylgalactosamine diphosphorylase
MAAAHAHHHHLLNDGCSSIIHNSPKPAILPTNKLTQQIKRMDALSLSQELLRSKLDDLRELWEKNNQGHVFKWTPKLKSKELTDFLDNLQDIDVVEVNKIYKTTVVQEEEEKNAKHDVKPFPDVTTFEDATSDQRAKWEQTGFDLIADGKVGVLLLAGGQASRLGCLCPKGTYDIGLPSKKSLYQMQVERTIRLEQLAAKRKGIDYCNIIWYIMTSPATYADTVAFFIENNYFGAKEENFFFFNQATLPCLQPDGKIINESASKIALAPNGNGGLYRALKTEGALEDMEKRGLKYITQYCVDNVLSRVADPVFIGFMHEAGADCAAKVAAKAFPEEPVGVMCLLDGKANVIEYSEIDPSMRSRIDPETNKLVYNYAHICINNFTVELLRRIADNHLDALRHHVARKKIPHAGEDGVTIPSKVENGWKLERFIFDAFQFANKMVAYEVRRDEEFSPLKNAAGMAVPKDSPETCLADVCRLHTRYIENAGGKIEGSDKDKLVEISPLVSYRGEGLEEVVKGKTFATPVYVH